MGNFERRVGGWSRVCNTNVGILMLVPSNSGKGMVRGGWEKVLGEVKLSCFH